MHLLWDELVVDNSNAAKLNTKSVVADLGDMSTLEASADKIFAFPTSCGEKSLPYTHTYFLNNAGSLHCSPIEGPAPHNHSALQHLQLNVDFNVTSCCFLTCEFVRRNVAVNDIDEGIGGDGNHPTNTITTKETKHMIINVSSLAAIQPFKTWGSYCAGKSYREMYHKTLALERPVVKPEDWQGPFLTPVSILNYSPGPMNTKMQEQIRKSEFCEKGTRDYFLDLAGGKEDFEKEGGGGLVNPTHSTEKLCQLIFGGDNVKEFKSGDHVDYFD